MWWYEALWLDVWVLAFGVQLCSDIWSWAALHQTFIQTSSRWVSPPSGWRAFTGTTSMTWFGKMTFDLVWPMFLVLSSASCKHRCQIWSRTEKMHNLVFKVIGSLPVNGLMIAAASEGGNLKNWMDTQTKTTKSLKLEIFFSFDPRSERTQTHWCSAENWSAVSAEL